ncbi:MAG: glycosyltransferase family 39 protein [Nitrospirae bacterium]|nr:glycosyltransferase family 39 protein [Nitrospirota bacterium]
MKTNRSSFSGRKRALLFIFLAALTLRIIAVTAVASFKGVTYPDDHEYGVIARSLIKGEGYSVPVMEILGKDGKSFLKVENYFFFLRTNVPAIKPLYGQGERELFTHMRETGQYRPSADQLPFYPAVLAVVYYFIKSPLCFWVIKFLQAAVSAATCVIIYLMAARLFNHRAAFTAGIISVIYPVFILNTFSIIPETFFTFWLSLSVLSLLKLKETPDLKHQVIAGLLIGITLLNSNVAVPMVPCIGIWLLTLNGTWGQRLKRSLVVMVAAFLIFCPWLVRNYIAFGEFPITKTAMGLNLWLGNNPNATGTFFQPSGERMEFNLPKPAAGELGLSEQEEDKKLYSQAISYVQGNPMHFARLFLKKLYYFTWFPPDNLMSDEGRLYKKIFRIPYALILVSSAAGFIMYLKSNARDALLLCAIILSLAVLYSVFIVGHTRYRMPIEPYIILFSSYAVRLFFDRKVPGEQYAK